jgi:type II restriction/modification system DNA methylase subunit YeeA
MGAAARQICYMPAMTPQDFIEKWRAAHLTERAGAQAHFLDLCELLGERKPHDADPDGIWYTFEKGAARTGFAASGYADVWKRHHFAWEYKGRHANLDAAFAQLQRYAIALENPPLLVVCDMATIRIHTNFTNSVQQTHLIALEDLADPAKLRLLKAVFSEPEALRPGETRQAITEKAARTFGDLAGALRSKTDEEGRAYDPQRVAHFLNKLVFCMFAEDIGLLPANLFTRLLDSLTKAPVYWEQQLAELFRAMATGRPFGVDMIPWFDGGLFADDDVLPLTREEIRTVRQAAGMDWSDIEPSIFGTLFERGLDPDKRSQLGAHYTDPEKIMKIVDPVVLRPLQAEWDAAKAEIAALDEKKAKAKTGAAKTKAENAKRELYESFRRRLAGYRVLDPACGSGNFLYMALLALKDFELRVMIEAEEIGLPREFPRIGPEAVKGIEINPYAAELARVTIWIGQIQWQLRSGFGVDRTPILRPLDQIECRDALLNEDGTEAEWPEVDAIVGNPPFLGDKLFLEYLGNEYTSLLRKRFYDKVPGGADLVLYWFFLANQVLELGKTKYFGLVGTNSIRGGTNRRVIDSITQRSTIFDAWSDEPWTVEGAAVRVSLVCCCNDHKDKQFLFFLNGKVVERINSDLSAVGPNLSEVKKIFINESVAFIGTQKSGAFDIDRELAEKFLQMPSNPNGRSNSDVIKPWVNGLDLTRRVRGKYIIDFSDMPIEKAQYYETPFQYIKEHVEPERKMVGNKLRREYWWLHIPNCPAMRSKLSKIHRFIATARNARHRTFVWLSCAVLPDCQVVAIARDDDTTFGILHSRFHETWSLRLGTWLGVGNDPRYTPTTTFETFPFPEGLTPDIPAERYAGDPRARAIAAAAKELDEKREAWLNPPDLVDRVPEVVPGYPDRLVPKSDEAAQILKKRTLTNLYNERPAWLDALHTRLDAAVARAYGWPEDISEEEALARLFALNQSRAAAQPAAAKRPRRTKAAGG